MQMISRTDPTSESLPARAQPLPPLQPVPRRPIHVRVAKRVHIFWQKRINDGDATTPWWYPSQTNSGAMREDRLVFPIPPGTHWSEVKAVAVPEESAGPAGAGSPKVLSAESKTGRKRTQHSALRTQHSRLTTAATGLRFGAPPKSLEADKAKGKRAVKAKAPKVKLDPRLLRATRELRDRYLEHVNTTPLIAAGKYDVARSLEAPPPVKVQVNPALSKRLPAAA